MGFRIGCDVGGTFTDLLAIDEETGRIFRTKRPSTPQDPSIAVVEGARALAHDAGIDPASVSHFLHGTTVATNAVLEGKGARVGLIVTEGYRQILHIARSFVPGGLAAWIVWNKPDPLAALEHSIEAPERIGADGAIVRPLDEPVLRERLESLKERGIEALTICFINSYVNDLHERRAAAICAEVFPDLPVSVSADILPEMQEYERALSTVANSAVRPVVARYVGRLASSLRDAGIKGRLNLLRSDGGLMSAEKAAAAPVNLLMSGPAGGVAGACAVARQCGHSNVLTLDMGGTSTDVALIEKGEPRLRRETAVGSLTVRAPALDVRTVGAGGGSIAHVPDLTGALRVGPQSAGADPGPAAYGKGGTLPTVTDANVVLGYLPESLLGGRMALDRDAAARAVSTIAEKLGISLHEAAAGIVDIANETMFGALRLVSVQQGYDPRDFALMAFGGAGPLHANALGRLMGSWPVIIPPSPGVLCAFGDAATRLRAERQRSFNRLAAECDDSEVRAAFSEIADSVAGALEAEGEPRANQTLSYEIDMRYAGQAFEVAIPADPAEFDRSGGIDRIVAAFDAEHERLFTFRLDVAHEIVNLRVTALGPKPDLPFETLPPGDGDPGRALLRPHRLWIDGAEREAAIYDRARLRAGDRIAGPAIIVEMDSTTLILDGHVALVDPSGAILIRPESVS